jgi:hypothetical protein
MKRYLAIISLAGIMALAGALLSVKPVAADSSCDCGCWMANTCGDITWEPCPGPSGKLRAEKGDKDERKLCKRVMKGK